jgi:hypothetical protein
LFFLQVAKHSYFASLRKVGRTIDTHPKELVRRFIDCTSHLFAVRGSWCEEFLESMNIAMFFWMPSTIAVNPKAFFDTVASNKTTPLIDLYDRADLGNYKLWKQVAILNVRPFIPSVFTAYAAHTDHRHKTGSSRHVQFGNARSNLIV